MKNHGPPGFSTHVALLPSIPTTFPDLLLFDHIVSESAPSFESQRAPDLAVAISWHINWQKPVVQKQVEEALFVLKDAQAILEASTAPSESSLSFEICLRSLAIRWDCLLLKASEAFSHRSSNCSLENAGRQWFSK